MATNNLSIILDLKDNASKALQGFEGKVKGLKSEFKGMAAVGTVAFAGIAAAVGTSLKAFAQQERADKRLETLIKNVVVATGEQVEVYKDRATWEKVVTREVEKSVLALKEQASALQKLGVVGDEVTSFGQSQLATFALQTETISKLTPGMLDLVVATKGVNATQEDMINIGNLVGKVMMGQVGALSRLGITFSEAQEEILKTGTEMERSATLSDVLAQNFGGLNEAARGTAEGGMQALKNSFGDMQEIIGSVFVPLLNDLVQKIAPVVDKIASWVQENPILTKNIALVSLAVAGLIGGIGTLGLLLPKIIAGFGFITTVVGALGTALAFLMANPIALILGGLVLLGAGLYLLYKNWDSVVLFVKELFIGLGNFFANWWTGLGDSTQGWLLLVGNILTGGLLGWIRLFIANFDSIKAVFASLFANMKDGFAITWDSITDIFKKAIDFIMKLMAPLLRQLENLKEGASIVGGSIKGGLGKAKSGIGGLFSSGGNFLKRTMSVNDAIISPDGNIITTHPDDYLIATKNPYSLGGGGGVVINITGNSFMGEDDMAEKIGNKLMSIVKLNAQV